jgi:hypothetical protein
VISCFWRIITLDSLSQERNVSTKILHIHDHCRCWLVSF